MHEKHTGTRPPNRRTRHQFDYRPLLTPTPAEKMLARRLRVCLPLAVAIYGQQFSGARGLG